MNTKKILLFSVNIMATITIACAMQPKEERVLHQTRSMNHGNQVKPYYTIRELSKTDQDILDRFCVSCNGHMSESPSDDTDRRINIILQTTENILTSEKKFGAFDDNSHELIAVIYGNSTDPEETLLNNVLVHHYDRENKISYTLVRYFLEQKNKEE